MKKARILQILFKMARLCEDFVVVYVRARDDSRVMDYIERNCHNSRDIIELFVGGVTL